MRMSLFLSALPRATKWTSPITRMECGAEQIHYAGYAVEFVRNILKNILHIVRNTYIVIASFGKCININCMDGNDNMSALSGDYRFKF